MQKVWEYMEKIEQAGGMLVKEDLLVSMIKDCGEDGEWFLRTTFNEIRYNVGESTIEKALGYSERNYGNYKDVSDIAYRLSIGEYEISRMLIEKWLVKFVEESGNLLIDLLSYFFKTFDRLSCKWVCRCVMKDLNCGIGLKTINKALLRCKKPIIQKFKVQLCDSLKDINDWREFPCFASIKYDGLRCVAEKNGTTITLTSRQGKNLNEFLPEIVKLLGNINSDFILDGEIIAKNFNEIQKRIGRKHNNINEIEGLQYVVFDILKWHSFITNKEENYNFSEECYRWNKIIEFMHEFIFNDANVNLSLTIKAALGEPVTCSMAFNGATIEEVEDVTTIPYTALSGDDPEDIIKRHETLTVEKRIICNCVDELKKFYKYVCDNKLEGIIIKKYKAMYIEDSRKNWFKVKPIFENSFQVSSYKFGKGKNKDTIGTVCVRDKTGHVVAGVGSGLTDEHRETFLKMYNNKTYPIIDVIYNEISINKDGGHSLRFPRFSKIRYDKNEADDLKSIGWGV